MPIILTEQERIDGYRMAQLGILVPDAKVKASLLEAKGWETWLRTCFPFAFSAPFSWFHIQFWDAWWDACGRIKANEPISPKQLNYLLLWGRALAKSSSGTPSTLMKAAFAGRTYSLYLSETYDQAISHLANVRYLITHPESRLAEFYPHLALEPTIPTWLGLKGKDTENVFITKGGSIFRALGIDTASRGMILGGNRPDDFNIDDIDDVSHGVMVSDKHLQRLTRSILLTRDVSSGLPVTAKILQNIVIEHGVVNQIHTGKSDAFAERTTIGLVNTFDHLECEQYIDADTLKIRHRILPASKPSWEAVDIQKMQNILDLIGYSAFMAECQNDFDRFKAGRVIPEYNEESQLITRSMFQKVFGVSDIPLHWRVKVGLDVGYSEGQYPHYSAWPFVATSAANSALPGKVFLFKCRTFQGVSIDDQATTIQTEFPMSRWSQVDTWQMSHEKTGEMLTLRQKYHFPFSKFQYYKAEDGVPQWRHLSRCDKTKPHPFKEDVFDEKTKEWKIGCPSLFYIVDDGQYAMPVDDRGLRLFREQVSNWNYVPVKVTEAGQTAQKPSKFNDDTCDALKSVLALFGPGIKSLTSVEKFEHEMADKGLTELQINEIEDEQKRLDLLQVRTIEQRAFDNKQKKKNNGYMRVGPPRR